MATRRSGIGRGRGKVHYRPLIIDQTKGRAVVVQLLTQRQRDYLRLRCAGMSDREIAAAMGTGLSNAHVLRAAITTRLGGRTIEEICRMAEAGESPDRLFDRVGPTPPDRGRPPGPRRPRAGSRPWR
jgi:DNA-binding CsgD family transcriptional regulator